MSTSARRRRRALETHHSGEKLVVCVGGGDSGAPETTSERRCAMLTELLSDTECKAVGLRNRDGHTGRGRGKRSGAIDTPYPELVVRPGRRGSVLEFRSVLVCRVVRSILCRVCVQFDRFTHHSFCRMTPVHVRDLFRRGPRVGQSFLQSPDRPSGAHREGKHCTSPSPQSAYSEPPRWCSG
jgi:hypothetical protein